MAYATQDFKTQQLGQGGCFQNLYIVLETQLKNILSMMWCHNSCKEGDSWEAIAFRSRFALACILKCAGDGKVGGH